MDDKQTVIGQDLDHLFATWMASEAEKFLEAIKSCEQIDEDCQPWQTCHTTDSHP
jgi:hypothetical protein